MGNNNSQWQGYDHQLLNDKEKQTVALADSAEKETTPIYRLPQAEKGYGGYLKADDEKSELDNGFSIFKYGASHNPKNQSLGYRPYQFDDKGNMTRGNYQWDTYETVYNDVVAVGNGLASLDCGDNINVGIFGINRPEWLTCHLANWSQNYRTVALYDTLGADAVRYIITHAECRIISCEKNKLAKLWEALDAIKADETEEKSSEIALRYVVQWDYQKRYGNSHETIDKSDIEKAAQFGLKLVGITDLIKAEKVEKEDGTPKPDDLAYIMYTSGTTGNPKGVKLTHKIFALTVGSTHRLVRMGDELLNADDLHVSYLPLAHSFEAAVIVILLSQGAKVAFFGGDIRKLALDWKELRPTAMIGVPRVFSKTYDKVMAQVKSKSKFKQYVFAKAQKSSAEKVRRGERSGFYDKAVWNDVAAEAGFDRLKFIASGAAPLPPRICEFLRIMCPKAVIVQGYGMTETCAISFVTQTYDITLGHVGVPSDNMEYRLVDAPECGYLTSDRPHPRGEVQMRGPTIMTGYYKNEEATKKCLSDDGWLSSGDIGRINPNGTLSIVDRRKNMFKTAMGEYVAAEKVENIYAASDTIGQIWLYGNGFKSFVVAIVVPEPLWAVRYLKEQGKWEDADDELVPATEAYAKRWSEVAAKYSDVLKEAIIADMQRVQKENGLKKFELIKDVHLETSIDTLLQGFNVENGTLTPTFKLKRPQLLVKYRNILRALYSANKEPPKDDEVW